MECNTICKHAINLKISLPYKKKVKIINISDVLSEVITTYCMDVSFTSCNRQWESIGITNIHGGVEYLDQVGPLSAKMANSQPQKTINGKLSESLALDFTNNCVSKCASQYFSQLL